MPSIQRKAETSHAEPHTPSTKKENKTGMPINEDKGLEHEADVMGAKASQMMEGQDAKLNPQSSRTQPMRTMQSNPAQLVTYAMKYTGETEKSFIEVVEDGVRISRQDEASSPFVKTKEEWAQLTAKQKRQVNVVAHGNVGQVGDFAPDTLITHLKSLGLKLDLCNKIVLYSCDSGVPDERKGATPETIYVNRVANLLPVRENPIEVVGMRGHVMMDSDGKSRVLFDPTLEQEYKNRRNDALKKGQEPRAIENEYLASERDSMLIGKPSPDAYHDPSLDPRTRALIEKGLEQGQYPPK